MYVNSLMRTCNTHANAGRHLVDRLFGVGSIRKDRRAAYLSPVPPPFSIEIDAMAASPSSRPLGGYKGVDSNPAIKRALERAKESAEFGTPLEDRQFQNASDWCAKLQHRVLSLYTDKQRQFDLVRLTNRLFRACLLEHPEDAREILETDLDTLHRKDIAGLCALVLAAINGSADVMDVLVQYGANTEHTDEEGNTAFVLAGQQGAIRMCKTLDQGGANVNAQNNVKKCALHYAVLANNARYVDFLFDKCNGVNPSLKDVFGMTPLLMATETGKLEIVQLLLKHGASPNETNSSGMTCLMLSSINDHVGVAEVLIDHGANVNSLDNRGESVLMFAAQRGQTDMLRILLAAGADQSIRTKQGETALDLAILLRRKRAERILRGRRASQASTVAEEPEVEKMPTPRYLRKPDLRPVKIYLRPLPQSAPTLEIEDPGPTRSQLLEEARQKERERRFARERKRAQTGLNVGYYTLQRRRRKEEVEKRRQLDAIKKKEEERLLKEEQERLQIEEEKKQRRWFRRMCSTFLRRLLLSQKVRHTSPNLEETKSVEQRSVMTEKMNVDKMVVTSFDTTDKPLGIELAQRKGGKGVVIKSVLADGVADKTKLLRKSMMLLRVNDFDVTSSSMRDILDTISAATRPLKFVWTAPRSHGKKRVVESKPGKDVFRRRTLCPRQTQVNASSCSESEHECGETGHGE